MDLAKHVISHQHDTKLLHKKLDVIGILNQKNAESTTTLSDLVRNENELLERIVTEYNGVPLNDLTSKLDLLSKQSDDKALEYAQALAQVEALDGKLTSAQQKTMDVIIQDGEINGKQLDDITKRVTDLTEGVSVYLDAMKLTEVRDGLVALEESNCETLTHQETTLADLDLVLANFKMDVSTLHEKIMDYHNSNQNITNNLSKLDEYTQIVDQKLSQTSPHFQAPNTEEMVEVYTSLAMNDIDLETAQRMLETESFDDILVETEEDTQNPLTNGSENDNLDTDQMTEDVAVTGITDEDAYTTDIIKNETDEKVGFFGRLFGKGN